MIERMIATLAIAVALTVTGLVLRHCLARRRQGLVANEHAPTEPIAPSRTPTLVYLYTVQCGQCRAQAHAIGVLEARLGDQVQIRRVDALAEPSLAGRYGIWTVPATVVLDRSGRPRAVNCGLTFAEQLEAQVRGATANLPPATASQVAQSPMLSP